MSAPLNWVDLLENGTHPSLAWTPQVICIVSLFSVISNESPNYLHPPCLVCIPSVYLRAHHTTCIYVCLSIMSNAMLSGLFNYFQTHRSCFESGGPALVVESTPYQIFNSTGGSSLVWNDYNGIYLLVAQVVAPGYRYYYICIDLHTIIYCLINGVFNFVAIIS